MSNIANKSEFNVQAAEELINKNLYAPSVHCSYYGCFQKMKSIFPSRLHITYEELSNSIKSKQFKGSEHIYVRTKIINDVEQKRILDTDALRKLEKCIKRLYDFRITADYKNECIYQNMAEEALFISKETIKTLTKIYR